jgi:predicted ATPase
MITAFQLKNFRSYREASLPLAPLTLLIGANASGKSNALEALHILSRMARGQYLQDVFKNLKEDGAIRGTIDDLTYGGGTEFSLGCTLSRDRPYHDFQITIRRRNEELIVVDEHMSYERSSFPLYRVEHVAEDYSHQLKIAYNNFARGGIKPQISCDNRQAVFTQLTTPARFTTPKAQEKLPEYTQDFRQMLEQMLFLDPIPQQMRGYSFVRDTDLQEDGGNISSVLYDLCREQQQKDRILDFVQALPEQDIRDIDFLETPRREVMVKLEESFGGHVQAREAALLSDGTLRVLAVAAAVLSAPHGSLVVIEEIDNGVHPSRAETLLTNIQQAAQERGLRVLLTTHSPALMDALSIDAIPDVVYCYRDPQAGDSRLVRLEDLADYPELIAQGTVGRLIQRGILERYLKRVQRPSEEKTAQALAWLQSLKTEGAIPQ